MFGLRFITLLIAAASINLENTEQSDASLKEFPHSASLIINGKVMCGASIIHEKLLLTAAQCLYGKAKVSVVEARIGNEDARNAPQVIRAKRWLIHNKYQKRQFDYDLCLIYLNKAIMFGEKVKKALLDFTNEPKPGMECYVAGWGAAAQNKMSGRHLKIVKQVIRSNAECADTYPKLSKQQICAGENDYTPFYGESGSALIQDGFKQIGLVSGGRPNISGFFIYSSIYHNKMWILKTIDLMLKNECLFNK